MTPVTLHTPSRLGASLVRFFALFCFITGLALVASAADAPKQSFDVPAAPAEKALRDFSQQAGLQVLFSSDVAKGVQTKAVKGEMTAREALDTMLADTGLVVVKDPKTEAFSIRRETPSEAKNGSSRPENSDRAAGDKVESGVIKLETFEVMGSKLLNMDIPRDRDGAQPWVIYDRKKIEQSGATNLEDFLKNRLSMNTQQATTVQRGIAAGGAQTYTPGSINLRGLGTNQTLILIDGRRLANSSNSDASPAQPAINGIPLTAIERIEVLPVTASAIYGGSATGGAINIIMRRDYNGGQVGLTYDNTFKSDTTIRRVDLTIGLNIGAKTNVLISGAYTTQNALTNGDRDFYRRAIQLALFNRGYVALNDGSTGLPPLGSTPNIFSTTGVNLTLKNGTPLNSPITFIPVGYRGPATDGTAALVANAGRYNLAPPDSAQLPRGSNQLNLLPPETTKSLNVTLRHQFTSRFQIFVEGSVTRDEIMNNGSAALFNAGSSGLWTIPASAPNNPFQQAVRVSVPTASTDSESIAVSNSTTRRLAGGLIVKLPADWTTEADYTWSQSESNFSTAPRRVTAAFSTALTTGAIDIFKDTQTYPVDFAPFVDTTTTISLAQPYRITSKDASLRSAGPIGITLPAGKIHLNTLLEHRDEQVSDGIFLNALPTGVQPIYYPHRSQSVNSVFVEADIPLVAERNRLPGIQTLDLQIMGRRDHYVTEGAASTSSASAPVPRYTNRIDSTDPTVAIRYQPIEDLALRASYGTGFLPPAVTQLVPFPPFTTSSSVADPLRGNTAIGSYTATTGGNSNLEPEESESFSAGIILTPRFVHGLRISIDYTSIEKKDNIASPTLDTLLAYFPNRISRGPRLPTDQPDWAGPIIAVDQTNINIAKLKLYAYDFQLDYRWDTGSLGELDFHSVVTWQPRYQTQAVPTASFIEMAGIDGGPVAAKVRGNMGVTWTLGDWTWGWDARYFGQHWLNSAHSVVPALGSASIPGQIYHDVFATYKIPPGHSHGFRSRILDRTEITLGIRNIANEKPPLRTDGAYYDSFGDPRLASYWLSVRKNF